MTNIELETLAAVSGGMKWENFRRSENIEDRRPPEAIRQDNAWMQSLGTKPPTDAQILDDWRRRSDDLMRGAK